MDFKTIMDLPLFELLEYLGRFIAPLPEHIRTPEECAQAQQLSLQISSNISYLLVLSSYAKAYTGEAKKVADETKDPEDKERYHDMVTKKEAIGNTLKALQQCYTSISRAFTMLEEETSLYWIEEGPRMPRQG